MPKEEKDERKGVVIVMLYWVVGQWGIPGSFRIWHGKGHPSPNQLTCKLWANLPQGSVCCFKPIIVLADIEFGTPQFTDAVRSRKWRAVVEMKGNRR